MGCICSKFCAGKKDDEKQEDGHNKANQKNRIPNNVKQDGKSPIIAQPETEESNQTILTNDGGTIDNRDKLPEEKLPSDINPKLDTQNGIPADIEKITIEVDEKSKPVPKPAEKENDVNQQNAGKRKKKKKKYYSSSDTSTSNGSSSDSDSFPFSKKSYHKKIGKDGSVTKVYSQTKFAPGAKIKIIKGENITINEKVINHNYKKPTPSRPKKTKTRQLFTQTYTEESARSFYSEPIPNGGGSFIDMTKYNLVEDVRSRKLLDKWSDSVGIIKSPRAQCTCFRVGSKYIMTALHGIKMMVKPEIQELQRQSCDNPTDWRRHIGKLLQPNYFVNFEYEVDGDHRESSKFYFNIPQDGTNQIPFYDESTDCIVLELKDKPNVRMPPSFKKFGQPCLTKPFSLVHHNAGKIKQIEPVDKIVDLDSQSTRADIRTLQNMCEQYLVGRGIDTNRFKCEYPPNDILGNRDRILFHCVASKGASGCPGIQVTSEGTVVVVTMLLHGYPDWYYANECQDIARQWDKAYTIEQGARLESIFSSMRTRNPDLFNDIFGVRPSRSVQPVEREPDEPMDIS